MSGFHNTRTKNVYHDQRAKKVKARAVTDLIVVVVVALNPISPDSSDGQSEGDEDSDSDDAAPKP